MKPTKPEKVQAPTGLGRAIVAALCVGLGLVLAFYFGIFVMLVGGIEQIVHGASLSPVSAGTVGVGSAKVFFCGAPWLFAYIGGILGAWIAAGTPRPSWRRK